jgi:hypothetical protein
MKSAFTTQHVGRNRFIAPSAEGWSGPFGRARDSCRLAGNVEAGDERRTAQ